MFLSKRNFGSSSRGGRGKRQREYKHGTKQLKQKILINTFVNTNCKLNNINIRETSFICERKKNLLLFRDCLCYHTNIVCEQDNILLRCKSRDMPPVKRCRQQLLPRQKMPPQVLPRQKMPKATFSQPYM